MNNLDLNQQGLENYIEPNEMLQRKRYRPDESLETENSKLK